MASANYCQGQRRRFCFSLSLLNKISKIKQKRYFLSCEQCSEILFFFFLSFFRCCLLFSTIFAIFILSFCFFLIVSRNQTYRKKENKRTQTSISVLYDHFDHVFFLLLFVCLFVTGAIPVSFYFMRAIISFYV